VAKTNGDTATAPGQGLTEVLEETATPQPLPAVVAEDADVLDTETQTIDAEDADPQVLDAMLNALKVLLSSVEKLQKVRQEVGDIKPLLVRMLDGELLAGEELEQLKTGVAGLLRLVRAYSDHQTALTKAQPARSLLDQVLKVRSGSPS